MAGEGKGIALSTVNPGFVLGAPLGDSWGTSVGLIQRIMAGKDPALPRLNFASVDVRDVAALHLAALEQPGTAGQRIMAASENLWFRDLALVIKDTLPDRKIVTREAPTWLLRLLALFDPSIRGILPDLDKTTPVNPARARAVLGRDLRDVRAAVADTARALAART